MELPQQGAQLHHFSQSLLGRGILPLVQGLRVLVQQMGKLFLGLVGVKICTVQTPPNASITGLNGDNVIQHSGSPFFIHVLKMGFCDGNVKIKLGKNKTLLESLGFQERCCGCCLMGKSWPSSGLGGRSLLGGSRGGGIGSHGIKHRLGRGTQASQSLNLAGNDDLGGTAVGGLLEGLQSL